MNLFKRIFLILTSLLLYKNSCLVHATHFNGAFFTAYPVAEYSDTIDVQFIVRVAYWRSAAKISFTDILGYYPMYCNQTTIENQIYIGTYYAINCKIGCVTLNETVGTTLTKCTAFSIINDWSMGENQFVFNIPKTSNYQVSTTTGTWRPLKLYTLGVFSYYWEIRLKIDSRIRFDTHRMNYSPFTFAVPVIVLSINTVYTLKLPTYDADGDVVKCRWGEYNKGECYCKTIMFYYA